MSEGRVDPQVECTPRDEDAREGRGREAANLDEQCALPVAGTSHAPFAAERPIRVLAVLPARLPSARIYLTKPLEALARAGRVRLDVAFESTVALGQILWCDVVALCRNVEPSAGWVLEEAIARGKATIYDLDDDLWDVPLDSAWGAYFRDPARLRQMERYLAGADAVRVYNPSLQRMVQRWNPRAILATPAIDLSLAPQQRVDRDDDTVRIVYAAGRGAGDNLAELFAGALAEVLEAHPETEAIFWCESPARLRGHSRVHVRAVTEDYDAFIRDLARGECDIGLAPLLATDFHLCKTDTKLRDYGVARIAGIYSNVDVYAAVTDGVSGLLVENTAASWRAALERLVCDRELRRSIAENAYDLVAARYRQEILEDEWLETLTALARAARERASQAGARVDGDPRATIERLEGTTELFRDEYERMRDVVRQLEERLARDAAEPRIAALEGELVRMRAGLDEVAAALAGSRSETSRLSGELAQRQAELARAHAEVARLAGRVHAARDTVRDTWSARARELLRGGDDGEGDRPALRQLADDSAIFLPDLDGAVLRPSPDLRSLEFLPYELDLGREGLCEVALAVVVETVAGEGTIGVELVSPEREIVAQVTHALAEVDPSGPVRFSFTPLAGTSRGRFELRVFARGVAVPLSVLEWRQHRLLGLASPRRMPYCGFGFAPLPAPPPAGRTGDGGTSER